MSFFRYLAVRKTNDTTYTQSIQFQNACIIASSFAGVHCGCLAFSDFGRLKFSPTSSPHFFLICAIYNDETLSTVCSNTYAFICSYVACLRSASVRAGQRSPWTFSASQPPLNPSRPCQVSHSHDASLRGVWTINIPSRRDKYSETYPRSISSPLYTL